MKNRALILAGLCFGVVLSLGVAVRAQAPANELYALNEFIVEPAKSADFEAAMKEWVAFYAQNKYPWAYSVFRTDDFRYYMLGPLKDMADLAQMMKTDMELMQKGGAQFNAMMKRTGAAMVFMNSGILVLRNDLSYTPATPRVKMEDATFICWDYYYGLPDKESEGEAIAKEWQALYKSKNIPDGFQTWMLMMGPDMPLYVAARWAKSPADFNAAEQSFINAAGAQYMPLVAKTMAVCRKFEVRKGYRLDALSYSPAPGVK